MHGKKKFILFKNLTLIVMFLDNLYHFSRRNKAFNAQYFVAIFQVKVYQAMGKMTKKEFSDSLCLLPAFNICFKNFYHRNTIRLATKSHGRHVN